MVFCYQNCSELLWEENVLKKFEIQGWTSRICKFFEITRSICSSSERSEQLLVTECFLTCSWRFLRYDKLEQLGFKLEKNIWIKKHAGKVRKRFIHRLIGDEFAANLPTDPLHISPNEITHAANFYPIKTTGTGNCGVLAG